MKKGSNHSCSDAEFCYSLWLHILVFLNEHGKIISLDNIGEIGNGGSFGVGICAILTGTKKYYALEIEKRFDIEQNLNLLNDLVVLFEKKTPIKSFPQLNIKINSTKYPVDIINPCFLDKKIVESLRSDIKTGFINSEKLFFINNWTKKDSLNLNFIFSRAVLEHVRNPFVVHNAAFYHLKNNCFVIHDIEFHSHGITENPSRYLYIPKIWWKIIFGKREYYINRWTLDLHSSTIKNLNFEIQKIQKTELAYKIQENPIIYGAVIFAQKVNRSQP
jgi:hypothetical protein